MPSSIHGDDVGETDGRPRRRRQTLDQILILGVDRSDEFYNRCAGDQPESHRLLESRHPGDEFLYSDVECDPQFVGQVAVNAVGRLDLLGQRGPSAISWVK